MNERRALAGVVDELVAICHSPDGLSLAVVQDRLGDRAWLLLLILLPLPFISPVPVPGLSTPFGLGLAVIGGALALGRTPGMPGQLSRLRCPPGLLTRAVVAALRVVARLQALVRPRFTAMADHRIGRIAAGMVIAVCGLLLALPLPIPFSNALPSYAILLLGIGLLERDGWAMMVGHVAFLVTLAFFALIGWGLVTGARLLA